MDLTQFTTDAPATRQDGWSPERKIRFLDHLSAKGNVRSACAAVGMSHEAAYRLRRRDPLFARGWDAALTLAREANAEVLRCRAIDGIEEDIWYRGELVGTRFRHDTRLLLAHLARLDKVADRSQARQDSARFDEILAVMLDGDPDDAGPARSLPPTRAATIESAVRDGERVERHSHADYEESEDEQALDEDERWELKQDWELECEALEKEAGQRSGLAAAALWDEWFSRACRRVDEVLAEKASDGTLSDLSTSLQHQPCGPA